MLSKCLNPACSAVFRYLGRGRLFRIDFFEAQRRLRHAGQGPTLLRERVLPVENFWLCEHCAEIMTVALGPAGEVREVPIDLSRQSAPEPVGAAIPPAAALPHAAEVCAASAS